MQFRASLNFRNFDSKKMGFTVPILNHKYLKRKLKCKLNVFLAGHTVVMVTVESRN